MALIKRLLFIIIGIIILLPHVNHAQDTVTFKKLFGASHNTQDCTVIESKDGGFVMLGTKDIPYSKGASDTSLGLMYLVKTDNKGNVQWDNIVSGHCGSSMIESKDGGFLLLGWKYDEYENNMYLVKTDSKGNELWSKSFDGGSDEEGESVIETKDGGIVMLGQTRYHPNPRGMYLVKTDNKGNEKWSKTFDGSSTKYGCSVIETKGGGLVLLGSTKSFGAGKSDMYLIKTDDKGNEQWSKTFGGKEKEYGYSVKETKDGGFILAGWAESFGAGDYDMYLVKTDSKGNEQWSKTFGGSSNDGGNSVIESKDGGFVLLGKSDSFNTGDKFANSDMYLVKTDSKGNELWSKTFGGDGSEESGRSVIESKDGGLVVLGLNSEQRIQLRYYTRLFLIKTDKYGYVNESEEDRAKLQDTLQYPYGRRKAAPMKKKVKSSSSD